MFNNWFEFHFHLDGCVTTHEGDAQEEGTPDESTANSQPDDKIASNAPKKLTVGKYSLPAPFNTRFGRPSESCQPLPQIMEEDDISE